MSFPASIKRKINWWLLLAAGILLLAAGFSSIIHPLYTYVQLVKYSGLLLLAKGMVLLQVITGNPAKSELKWLMPETIIDFLFAVILLLFNPFLTFIIYPMVLGLWIIITGIIKIWSGLSSSKTVKTWSATFAVGVLSLLFGILLEKSPYQGRWNPAFIFGCFAITIGALYIVDAVRFRNSDDELDILL